jgi:hypothetical protein
MLVKTKGKEKTLKIKGIEFNERQIQAMANTMVAPGTSMLERVSGVRLKDFKTKNDPASASLGNTSALQGPLQGDPSLGGAFSAPGIRPQRFSAVQRPRSFARLLQPRMSEWADEKLGVLTAATDGSGANAAGYCDNPPTPGDLLTCDQLFTFGDWYEKIELNSIPQIGLLRNRAEVPGQILNAGPQQNPLIPDLMYRVTDTRSQLQFELYNLGMDKARNLEKVLILGDHTKSHTVTQHGFIKEFDGIDVQIKTGSTDISGVACPALDSIVENFNSNQIGTTVGGGDPRTITNVISDVYYAATDRAEQTGFEGADGGSELGWIFIMRKEMFRALTDVYANTYATSRFQANSLSAGTPLLQDGQRTNDLRLEMLNGKYLIVEGQPIPVFFSDGIPLTPAGNNTYEADMYFGPISWNGMPLINLEYFNMANQYAVEYQGFVNADDQRVLNNGLYRVGYRSTGLCKEYHFADKMRLILETRFLFARIDNVDFTYYAKTRSAYPGTSLYAGGGRSYQN